MPQAMSESAQIIEIDIFQPRDHLIRQLEGLLKDAKTGELTGLISVSLWQGGNVSHGYSLKNGDYFRTLVGEMEILKHALIDQDRHQDGAGCIV